MPFTPYHFGPSGFVGLLLRRWIDVPVFIAANVLIDLEVIADSGLPWYFSGPAPQWWFRGFAHGWPVHQIWHFHTLLIGGLAGAVFGLLIYCIKPFRWCCEKLMALIGLPSKATPWSMGLAGLLGVWLHVLIDSFYHYDVQILWPHKINTVFRWLRNTKGSTIEGIQQLVVLFCVIFWMLTLAWYVILLIFRLRKMRLKTTKSGAKTVNFDDDKS